MDLSSIFRNEALEAAKNRYGAPSAILGVPSWVITAFLAVVFASALIFVANAHYAKRETVLGLVVPAQGVARIAPLKAGVVKKVFVKSGDTVAAEQSLFLLTYDSVLENGSAFSEGIADVTARQSGFVDRQAQIKKQQLAQSKAQITERIAGLLAEAEQYTQQQKLQAERVTLLEQTQASLKSLQMQNFISPAQVRQREDDLIKAKLELVQIGQNIAKTKSAIAAATAQLPDVELEIQDTTNSLQISKAQLAERRLQAMSAQATQLIAPKSGQVTAVQVREGDLVSAGQTMGFIVPHASKSMQQVHLWVPSKAIGFVEKGVRVRLMLDAFPYQTFGVVNGIVTEVATAPLMPAEVPMPIKEGEQLYRVVVGLHQDSLTAFGRKWPLSPGMRLSADLVLMERSLLDWVLEPLTAVTKRNGS
ncbi:HlyD family efflux transporter periplasmic adaptor subunit [[Empedobacter] haloabium]|uniref:HlyD family efflux transporter periplasmic adaptor subunit n=1 Tax=[Empedobacter] haloabium TaxID=592317 RepID=A0ABZ1US52_9BURK